MLFENDGFILNSLIYAFSMAKCRVYSEEERIVQMAHLTSIIIEINLFYSATSEEAVAFHIFPKAQETSNTIEYSLAQHFIPLHVVRFVAFSFSGFPDNTSFT